MGRLASGNARKYQIMELWDRHHAILRLLALGMTPKQVAEELGCTTATVGNVQHGELGKRQLSLLRSAADNEAINIMEDIKKLAPVAVARLEEILVDKNSDAKLVASVAHDILDRAGHAAPKIIQGQFTHAHLTKDDIEELKARARSITVPNTQEEDDEVIDV
jgi:transcriptional regulator with XRE-family HTH domain